MIREWPLPDGKILADETAVLMCLGPSRTLIRTIADVERARVELVETVPPEQRALAVSHLVDAWMHHVELAGQAMLDRAETARKVAA